MQDRSAKSTNKEILSYLQTAARNKSLSHAYALIGPSASNRMQLVEDFLITFIPTESIAHPDINTIESTGHIITIDTVRKARYWLSMTPISADKKVLIMQDAHTMNREAQNAFLKILEEPAVNTYIFLTLNHKDQILPTVYSRIIPLYCASELSAPIQLDSEHLMRALLMANNAPERMRLWINAAIPKDEIYIWLEQALPQLAKELRNRRKSNFAQALRELLQNLAHPVGQNWQLITERFITAW